MVGFCLQNCARFPLALCFYLWKHGTLEIRRSLQSRTYEELYDSFQTLSRPIAWEHMQHRCGLICYNKLTDHGHLAPDMAI
jgi:hypothetical protein